MKRIATLITLIALCVPATATTTVTRALVAQAPVYQQDEAGNLIVGKWTDVQEWGQPLAPAPIVNEDRLSAVARARQVGGRVIVRVTTVNDNNTPGDEADDDTTLRENVVAIRDTSNVTITLPRDRALLLVGVLASTGQKWADVTAQAIRQALGLA